MNSISNCRFSTFIGCELYLGTRSDCRWRLNSVKERKSARPNENRRIILDATALPTLGHKRADATTKSIRSHREILFRLSFITDLKDTGSRVKFTLKRGAITIIRNADEVITCDA